MYNLSNEMNVHKGVQLLDPRDEHWRQVVQLFEQDECPQRCTQRTQRKVYNFSTDPWVLFRIRTVIFRTRTVQNKLPRAAPRRMLHINSLRLSRTCFHMDSTTKTLIELDSRRGVSGIAGTRSENLEALENFAMHSTTKTLIIPNELPRAALFRTVVDPLDSRKGFRDRWRSKRKLGSPPKNSPCIRRQRR